MKLLFKCTIPGRPIVKKNTQRIFGSGRMKRAVYSPKYTQWEKNAIAALLCANKGPLISCPLEARFKFYFVNHQAEPDASNLIEGPQDALKKAGVISDDRIIQRVTAEKFFGGMAMTEIELYEFEVCA